MMLGLTFSSKLNWGSYIVTIASKKIEALIRSMKFFLLRLLCISINLPYAHAWNTVVTSRQVPLVTASNCQISCKNGYAGLMVLDLLPLMNPWLTVEMQPPYIFSTGIILVYVHLNWLNCFHLLFLERGLLVILIDCMIFLSPFVDVTRMSMSTVSFLAQLDSGIICLQNAFP